MSYLKTSLRATPALSAFSLRVSLTGLGDSGLVLFFLMFIYLAALSLSCDTQDSIVAAHELLVAVCGI